MSVLESPYTLLQKSGIPLPVCICMQGKGLQLGDAQWTARQSTGGFSVTFFWPALNLGEVDVKATKAVVKKRKKSKRRREAKTQPHEGSQEVTVAHHGLGNTSFAASQTEFVTPDNAHHSAISHHAKDEASANSSTSATLQPTMPLPDTEEKCSATADTSVLVANQFKQPDVVDLSTCESVTYEMKDRIPSVKYTKNGDEEWTPVVKRSHRKRRFDHASDNSESSDTSGSELDVSCSRKVQYSVREGVPGVSIHRRNVTWKLIMPNPVANRTRSKFKKTDS